MQCSAGVCVCVRVSSHVLCVVFMCSPPPCALTESTTYSTCTHAHTHTRLRPYSRMLVEIRSLPTHVQPRAHIRGQHDPAFRFVCANIVWCPLLFLCASCPAHARTRSTGRAWAVCVCAISVVVLLGVVLRHLSLRCIKCMRMWYVEEWECVSICECVCIVCAFVCARGWGCVCMHVYVSVCMSMPI